MQARKNLDYELFLYVRIFWQELAPNKLPNADKFQTA